MICLIRYQLTHGETCTQLMRSYVSKRNLLVAAHHLYTVRLSPFDQLVLQNDDWRLRIQRHCLCCRCVVVAECIARWCCIMGIVLQCCLVLSHMVVYECGMSFGNTESVVAVRRSSSMWRGCCWRLKLPSTFDGLDNVKIYEMNVTHKPCSTIETQHSVIITSKNQTNWFRTFIFIFYIQHL